MVILTARDEKRGKEAVQKLQQQSSSSSLVVFHQVDVMDPQGVSSLVNFIKSNYGKLDILVNHLKLFFFFSSNYRKQTFMCVPSERA